MAYMRSMRAPRVRVKTALEKESQIDGFKAGILACAWVINEMVELDTDELAEIIQQAITLMYEIGQGKRDPKRINATLESMTGISIIDS